MLTEITKEELQLLEDLKVQRLQELVEPLRSLKPYIDLDHNLQIFCSTLSQAEALLSEPELRDLVWSVVGCYHLSIWHDGQIVWSGESTELPEGFKVPQLSVEELESIVIDLISEDGDIMATGVLEKPAVAEQNGGIETKSASSAETLYTVEEIAQNLAGFTKLPLETLIEMILSTRPLMRYEQGQYKLSASAGAIAFRQWAAGIEQKLEAGELLPVEVTSAQPAAETPAPAPAKSKTAATKKPAAKKTSTAKKSTAKKSAPKKEEPAE